MSVLFCFPWGYDDLGGAQVSVLLLAEGLLNRGHRVGMVEMAALRSTRAAAGVAAPVWTLPVQHPPRHVWSWRGTLAAIYRLQRVIAAFRPDIVSVQCPARQSPAVVGTHTLPHRWRLVVTARAESEIRAETAEDWWLRGWIRRLLGRADAVTTVSEALRRELVALYPFAGRRTKAIPNGVGPLWFTAAAPAPGSGAGRYLLYAGRLDYTKGIDILLRAWREVQASREGVALWLAGEGPERAKLAALAAHLGVGSQLRFLGRVPPERLPALYRDAALVVLPSRGRSEGLSRVLLEAGASGAICVATRVGGAPEVIEEGVTGFLSEPESHIALAGAMQRGLRLPEDHRRTMKAAAKRRIAERFSHERTTLAYEALFRSLLGARRGATVRNGRARRQGLPV